MVEFWNLELWRANLYFHSSIPVLAAVKHATIVLSASAVEMGDHTLNQNHDNSLFFVIFKDIMLAGAGCMHHEETEEGQELALPV